MRQKPRTTNHISYTESWLCYLIPFLFLAIICLALLVPVLENAAGFLQKSQLSHLSLLALLNAATTALAGYLLNYIVKRRKRHTDTLLSGGQALLLGLAAGGIIPFAATSPILLFCLTITLIALVWINLRRFIRRIVTMLRPQSHATWADIQELARIYLMLLTAFTLTNASLDALHRLLGNTPPFGFSSGFGFFLDSLYFSCIMMTTVGFGDIAPSTLDAKLLVGLEAFTSYIVFALLVGIITRGVLPVDRK
ncbi:potassium channel family protein [Oleidesulfovibrio sp.]|uniref:potassium channel family protein n=1 Tax=Oleidesulfovibrio sp. TaxID=2909707 RepID=UPI003A838D1B